MRAQDHVSIDIPLVLRDAVARHRLHPRMALHEIIEEALHWWEEAGGWTPVAAISAPTEAGHRWPALRPRRPG